MGLRFIRFARPVTREWIGRTVLNDNMLCLAYLDLIFGLLTSTTFENVILRTCREG